MHSATIDAISRHSGTPVGSLYHRFGSRDRLLAEMWVRGVRRSQAAFIVAARHREPEQAAVDAALSIYEFVRQHPADARLLTSFRRHDLVRDARSPGLIRELQQLNQPLEAAVTVLARRVFGKPTCRAVAQTLLATIDIPMGMVRRYLDDRKRAEERTRQEEHGAARGNRSFFDVRGNRRILPGAPPGTRTGGKGCSQGLHRPHSGETRTGKELIVRAIHKRSNRSTRAFLRVHFAAIPQSLIASELFGHEKGGFTGALQWRVGRFEAADGGTIFLDEIGELPVETQIALLRVLQERGFERIGSTAPLKVDVRVIAATNRDLGHDVEAGIFRQDLFYRLNVFRSAYRRCASGWTTFRCWSSTRSIATPKKPAKDSGR